MLFAKEMLLVNLLLLPFGYIFGDDQSLSSQKCATDKKYLSLQNKVKERVHLFVTIISHSSCDSDFRRLSHGVILP